MSGRFLAACGSGTSANPPGPHNSGVTPASMAVGAAVLPTGADYILARDAGGFYAYSMLCTHQGCAIPVPTQSSGNSVCPCHQARFDANGDNVAGPNGGGRIANLPHYTVSMNTAGELVVDTSMAEADRTARFEPSETPPTDDAATATDAATTDASGTTM